METNGIDRRTFLGAAAGSFAIIKPELVRGSQRNSAVRMALFGCGGRGTGVARNFTKETAAQYVALGDLFQEQTEKSQAAINKVAEAKGKAAINPSGLIYGPKSLEKIAAMKDVDVIHIATPPYFHPAHLEVAAASGKHIYLEKPVAVDVPGSKRVMNVGAKVGKKASLAVGFQLRHATPYVQLAERVKRGDIGDIVCGLIYYYAGAIRADRPAATPEARRLRNWIHDRVLSGDILVEQNIHLIDVTNWLLQGHPVKASAVAGKKGRKDAGDCSSHYNVNYTYPNDVHITLTSTQFVEGGWDVQMRYFGTGGAAIMSYDSPVEINGPNKWSFPLGKSAGQAVDAAAAAAGAFKGALDDADTMKERYFINSIVSGNYINEAEQGGLSALSAILGRQAAYTGRSWTWDELLKVQEVWDAKLDITKMA